MRCIEILGKDNRNTRENVLDDFLYVSVLTWVKDYGFTYDHTLINESHVDAGLEVYVT